MKLAGPGSNNASAHSENETVLPVIPLHCQQPYTVRSLTVFSAWCRGSHICPARRSRLVMMCSDSVALPADMCGCVCPGSEATRGPRPPPSPQGFNFYRVKAATHLIDGVSYTRRQRDRNPHYPSLKA